MPAIDRFRRHSPLNRIERAEFRSIRADIDAVQIIEDEMGESDFIQQFF